MYLALHLFLVIPRQQVYAITRLLIPKIESSRNGEREIVGGEKSRPIEFTKEAEKYKERKIKKEKGGRRKPFERERERASCVIFYPWTYPIPPPGKQFRKRITAREIGNFLILHECVCVCLLDEHAANQHAFNVARNWVSQWNDRSWSILASSLSSSNHLHFRCRN